MFIQIVVIPRDILILNPPPHPIPPIIRIVRSVRSTPPDGNWMSHSRNTPIRSNFDWLDPETKISGPHSTVACSQHPTRRTSIPKQSPKIARSVPIRSVPISACPQNGIIPCLHHNYHLVAIGLINTLIIMCFRCECGYHTRTSGKRTLVYLLQHVRDSHDVCVCVSHGHYHFAHCNEDDCLRDNGHGRSFNSFEALHNHLHDKHRVEISED
jgi:hypothetical protein